MPQRQPVYRKLCARHGLGFETMWLPFGDLSGGDFWRNKNTRRHAGFAEEPKGGLGRGRSAMARTMTRRAARSSVWRSAFGIRSMPEGMTLLVVARSRRHGKVREE
jgi:hypothetical protein